MIAFVAVFWPCRLSAESPDAILKVGVILPLSGIFSDYGMAMKNGISLAQEKNQEKASGIRFIFEDAQASSHGAIAAFNKLVDTDRVKLVYVFGVQFSQALAPLARARKIPLVSQCVSDEVARNNPFVLRFMNHAGEYTAVTLDYLRRSGFNRIEVITSEQSYTEEMYRALEGALAAPLSLKRAERYPAGETDFRATISRIKNNPPDALGVYLLPGQISSFYRQLREQYISLPTFGVFTFDSKSEIGRAEGAMEGVVFPTHHVEGAFRREYLDRFQSDAQLTWAALAYEFARALAPLSGKLAKSSDGESVIGILSRMPPATDSAAGRFEFAHDERIGAYFKFPLVLKVIRSNSIEEVSHPAP